VKNSDQYSGGGATAKKLSIAFRFLKLLLFIESDTTIGGS
jgi:hypothetical protein